MKFFVYREPSGSVFVDLLEDDENVPPHAPVASKKRSREERNLVRYGKPKICISVA